MHTVLWRGGPEKDSTIFCGGRGAWGRPCTRTMPRLLSPSIHGPVQGVGSHAATMLLRSGVGRLRLIDFDQVRSHGPACSALSTGHTDIPLLQVSLSSLNRHATATREDVGLSKAACLQARSRCSIAIPIYGGTADFTVHCRPISGVLCLRQRLRQCGPCSARTQPKTCWQGVQTLCWMRSTT